MEGVNKVILLGNLGKDPEYKEVNGVGLAKFTLATSSTYKDKNGQKVTNTEWHNISVWRGLAEVAKNYLKKGNSIYLEGKLRTTTVEDKETGAKRYFTEIVGDSFTMLGGKKENGQAQTENVTVTEKEEEPLPF